MDDNANDRIIRGVEFASSIIEHPFRPSLQITTPFRSLKEWLHFLCEHEHRTEPVSDYMIAFSDPPQATAYLVGYEHGVENGIPVSRIVFQPKQFTWFSLPEDRYGGLNKEQLIDKVHAELYDFFTTERFRNSFLARGYHISTNFKEDIWSL
ncbi:hypothetical protein HRH25_11570 [Flavisolibacter sp. BT320]|nr:hypothetical protein [Flavisolibacter longurius]